MTSRGCLVAFLPAVLSFTAFAQNDQATQRGAQLFRQGQYAAALEEFQTAQHNSPTDPKIENLIGITQTKLGQLEDADSHFIKATKLAPEFADAYKNLGFNYLNAKQYQLAEEALKTAVKLKRDDSFAHYYLLLLYLALSKNKEAADQIEPAMPRLNDDPDTAFTAAKVCLREGNESQALTIIHALEIHPGLSVGQEYELATLLDEKRSYPEVTERFRRIVSQQPASWTSKYDLALALLRNKQPKEAASLLEALAEEHTENADIMALLGMAYESENKLQQALTAYQKAIGDDPQNTDHYLDSTRILMNLDRYDDAVQLIEQRAKNTQDTYALNIRMGAVLMMEGKYSDACQYFQRGIDAHPEIAIGHVALADAYMKQGKDEDALKVLTGARGKLPQDFALEYVFGLVSSKLEKDDQAIAALQAATSLSPTVVEPYYELGKIYFRLQKWTEARKEFEHILSLNPQYANAYYQLSRTYMRLGEAQKSQEMAERAKELQQTQREQAITIQKARFTNTDPDPHPDK